MEGAVTLQAINLVEFVFDLLVSALQMLLVTVLGKSISYHTEIHNSDAKFIIKLKNFKCVAGRSLVCMCVCK